MELEQTVTAATLEMDFREALLNVAFLGYEAAKIRTKLANLRAEQVFERTFHTRQWYYVLYYHNLWCDTLAKRGVDYMRIVMTI